MEWHSLNNGSFEAKLNPILSNAIKIHGGYRYFYPMFHTPKLTRSTKKGTLSTQQRSIKRSPVKQEVYLLQTPNVIVQRKGVFPEQIKQQSKNQDSFQFGSVDSVSGFTIVSYQEECVLWNYQTSSEPFKFKMPSTKLNPFCLSAIIPASNFQGNFGFMTQSVGLVVQSSEGILRYWRDVQNLNNYIECTMEQDSAPWSLMFCDHAGIFIGFESGAVVRVTFGNGSLHTQYLARPASLQKSLIGFITGSSSGNTILNSSSEILLAIVPGATNFETECQNLYVLSNTSIQKWVVSFLNHQEMVSETNLVAFIRTQCDLGDFEIVDMDFGKQGRLVFLVLEILSGQYSIIVCEENSRGDNLELKSIKRLAAHEGEGRGTISLSNGGPIALVQFSNRLHVKYIFEETEFEQIIPFKRKDVVGCGVDRSKLDLETVDSKSVSALCCSETGILEIVVNISNLVRAARKPDNVQSSATTTDFYAKLEQAVFFSNDGEEYNPINFDLGGVSGDIDDQCLALSKSILDGTNQLLKNTLDEAEYLADAAYRLENIPRVLDQNRLLDSVQRILI